MVVLQACHIAELSGTLHARQGARLVSVGFEAGEVVAADALDCEGIDAVMALTGWTEGRFDFVCRGPAAGAAVPGPFNWLMLEVCRRLDEASAVSESVAPRASVS